MLVTMNFDLTNVAQSQIFAQVCALASQGNIPMDMNNVAVSASPVATPVASPVAETKTYAPAEDVQCAWVVDKTKVSYTLADGKYVGQTGVRKTLNARLRDAGATYDVTKKAWVFKSAKAAQTFVESDVTAHYTSLDGIDYAYPTIVTASEIEAVRAKAQARAQKKAQA